MSNKKNNQSSCNKVFVSVTKHGAFDNALFNTTKSTLHTLNLPTGAEHLETVLNIHNDEENAVVNIVGSVVCASNKKRIKSVLLYEGGYVQLTAIESLDPNDGACIWESRELTNSTQVE